MSSRATRIAALLLPLALAAATTACGRESAFAQTLRNRSVHGTYVYAARGSTVSIPWAFDAKLVFDGHGAYVLDLHTNVKGEPDHDTDRGSYRVDGDRIYIRGDGKHDSEHELRIAGDSVIADLGWPGSTVLRLAGVPKPVFVKQ